MQYVWQHRLWPPKSLATVDGRPVHVIDPGQLNTTSGPDFFNAKISIDGRTWAGDVEIHVRASDWKRHGHDGDPAYDSVILHVVDVDDCAVKRINGETIPQMQLPCNPNLNQAYNALLLNAPTALPCASFVRGLDQLYVRDWLTALAFERLYEKSRRVLEIAERNAGDWNHACYLTLARALGFGLNAQPMERLAAATPLKVIYKHADNLLSVEALLMGQSGLLDDAPPDMPYPARLMAEYKFLAKKFGLTPVDRPNWKSGLRPGNLPHRRIALLALLLAGDFHLFEHILQIRTIEDARWVFDLPLHGFWQDNYTFAAPARKGTPTQAPPRSLSNSTLSLLMINVVVPLIVAHGQSADVAEAFDTAVALLEGLPPERNRLVTPFEQAGIKIEDALTSQSLLFLQRNFCAERKCLFCRFGHRLLAKKALRHTYADIV